MSAGWSSSARRSTTLAAIRRTVTLGGGMTFEDGMKLGRNWHG
jgi:hypothetical protein